MCQFVSWVEYEGKEYFLTNSDIETKEGSKLLKSDVRDDLCGHGAILSYYPELKGKGLHKECEDFSTQKNFPKSIAKALKSGSMSRIGINTKMLTAPAEEAYQKATAPAEEAYQKAKATAWEAYQKATATAFTNIVKQKKNRNKNWK